MSIQTFPNERPDPADHLDAAPPERTGRSAATRGQSPLRRLTHPMPDMPFVDTCTRSPVPECDVPPADGAVIRGSTTIEALMERFPDGRALDLMSRLGWPCGHCSARATEPLALAAKRHGNPVRAVIACFRALAAGEPFADMLEAARPRPRRSPDPIRAWRRSAERYGGV